MRIRELREHLGLMQKELAQKLGLGLSTLCQYETGKRQPDYATLQRIADFFEVSVDYLLGREEKKELSLDDQLQGIDFALWGEVKDLTDEEKQDILDFVKFKKSQRR